MIEKSRAKSVKTGVEIWKIMNFETFYIWNLEVACMSSLGGNTAETTCNTSFIGRNLLGKNREKVAKMVWGRGWYEKAWISRHILYLKPCNHMYA